MRIWRLNVKSVNLDASVQYSMFALSRKPKLKPGDLLLLQLEKGDAKKEGKLDSRVEYVIVFDHLKEDIDGSISRKYWPKADRIWKWIIYGSKTLKTKHSAWWIFHLFQNLMEHTIPQYILIKRMSLLFYPTYTIDIVDVL